MRTAAVAIALLVLAGSAPAQEAGDDLIFRVLRHEITRSMERLKLEKSAPPYYLRYQVRDTDQFQVTASFGAVTQSGGGRRRSLDIDLRVGDYALDNTNFAEGSEGGGAALTVDDDYEALRQSVWLATDLTYKTAVETLEQKKAYLAQHSIPDRPADFSKEEAFVLLREPVKLDIDREKWTGIARKASAVFRQHPHVQKSFVQFMAGAENRWFLSSEGFRHRTGKADGGLIILAAAQADDGMKLTDFEVLTFPSLDKLPSEETVVKAAEAVAARLKELVAAPKVDEEYTGPILFEGSTAADFFAHLLPGQLGNSHEPVGARNPNAGNQWKDKLDQRVLPAFLSVISDPTAAEFKGQGLLGSYEVDDDGVKARRVALVERGKLKTFAMSRIPTRKSQNSNGHSRGGVGQVSNLFVESTKQMNAAKLRERLVELAADEDLRYVYICRRLGNVMMSSMDPAGWYSSMMGRGGILLPPPVTLVRYEVATGKETLVRGGRFKKLELRVLRDIVATGDDAAAYTPVVQGLQDVSIVTPTVLVKEVEIARPPKELEKLPSLPAPAFERR